MKVDILPTDWDGEEVRHRKAISDGAFSGKIPQIALSLEADEHYCMLIKLAGQSRIKWRPLVADHWLFRSAYTEFSKISWTPDLFTLGEQQTIGKVITALLGYKLLAEQGGRIHTHVSDFISSDILGASLFFLHGQILPNPVVFATSDTSESVIRPFFGPTHGDCHSQNLFVKAGENGNVHDINLIDFATYQSNGPVFFDHAYLELATLLRTFDGLGIARWHKLAEALAEENEAAQIDPGERGWLQDILTARKTATELAFRRYPDRQDDLKLQMVLAQVGAGLAFLHKTPRAGSGSGGLTTSQYSQSFVWSAVFLKQLLNMIGKEVTDLFPNGTAIPWPNSPVQIPGRDTLLSDFTLRFDNSGFNILIVGNDLDTVPPDIASAPWSFVIDFRTSAPTESEQQANPRASRQFWPGQQPPDLKILHRGCIWYFANGRQDISGVVPTVSTTDWRRTYKRGLDHLLGEIARSHAPTDVRCLVLANGLSQDIARMVIESMDMEFGETLAPVSVADGSPELSTIEGVEISQLPLDTIISELVGNRAASPRAVDDALLPQRTAGSVGLVQAPAGLLSRVDRDLTVLYRARAQSLPQGRSFGIDFRRGMPIEWAELAQQLDVPRENAFDTYNKEILEALEASSNRTVNLFHEPSSGGTTLARRLAWSFMERVPTVILDQISSDTSSYLRDVFQFCSLPVLVVMEASVVTESEREGLLQQLREDNTRAVFLTVSRSVKKNDSDGVLSGRLNDEETRKFLKAYLEQVEDPNRQSQLRRLASPQTPGEQKNPFFFGLTAFGEGFLGVQKLIEDVVKGAKSDAARELLADLSLVSFYYSEGFPEVEFDELCDVLNDGNAPVDNESLFLLRSGSHIRVSHALLAREVLANLARNEERWHADISRFSTTLLSHLRRLRNNASDRVQRMVQSLFITRDTESAILADVDVSVGGIGSRRFSQLINDIGNAELARKLFDRITQIWPREPHYAAHLARHLMYEDPKDIDEAVRKASFAEQLPDAGSDATLVHVAGMAHRIRMEQILKEAITQCHTLGAVETAVQSDFVEATSRFERSTQIKPSNEHGLVATIQTVSILLRQSMRLSGVDNFSAFLTARSSGFYMDALSLAEENIDLLKNRPRLSIRAEKTIAEWNNVYGNTDRVVSDLRALAARREDLDVRRALCAAIIARAKHNWRSMSQGDLRTIVLMMERNINQQGVRDADIRRWFSAYRHLNTFDESIAIQRLIDWHGLSSKSVEPAYYLFALNFLRFLSSQGSLQALATEVNSWNQVCQNNRPYGSRSWSYDWLERTGKEPRLAHFKNDLEDLDPPSMIKGEKPADLAKLEARLARVEGTLRGYRGPQFANLDLGFNLFAKITPLDRLSKDDEGKRISAFISFSYDGLIGWDPKLVQR
ncbi:hypothetical protein [Martelella radicis]|uniref:Uncharacterized protein n=1 Tax=Martelella radicis TaxID=1397476 RepID=A0A7W6P9P8_9HYPH|nr:hypothetical protein [Martelella radicis]MBB4120744.1 hypothetical protein [Martelella radicis]